MYWKKKEKHMIRPKKRFQNQRCFKTEPNIKFARPMNHGSTVLNCSVQFLKIYTNTQNKLKKIKI